MNFSPSPAPGTLGSAAFGQQKIDESQPFASFLKQNPQNISSDEEEDKDESDEEHYASQGEDQEEGEEGEFDSDDEGEFEDASDEEEYEEEEEEEEIDIKDPKVMRSLGAFRKGGSSILPSTRSKGHVGKTSASRMKTPESKKKVDLPAKPTSGLFGRISSGPKKEEDKQEEKTGGLFGFASKKDEEKKPAASNPFGGSVTPSLGGSFLGGHEQKTNESKKEGVTPVPGLFGASLPNKPTSSIFGQAPPTVSSPSPFAPQSAKSGDLFSSQPPPPSPKPAEAPKPAAPMKKPEPEPEPEPVVIPEDEELRDYIQNTPVEPCAELRSMRKLIEEEVPEVALLFT